MNPLTTDQIMQQKDDQISFADRVLFIFRAKAVPLTPWMAFDIYRAWFGACLIGSIRRQITNLTPDHLTKTDKRVPGPWKAGNGMWILNSGSFENPENK